MFLQFFNGFASYILFADDFSRSLGKRLIHMQSHSMDMEEAMINRLKQVSAFHFSKQDRERVQSDGMSPKLIYAVWFGYISHL
jgi:hypothetical protein